MFKAETVIVPIHNKNEWMCYWLIRKTEVNNAFTLRLSDPCN